MQVLLLRPAGQKGQPSNNPPASNKGGSHATDNPRPCTRAGPWSCKRPYCPREARCVSHDRSMDPKIFTSRRRKWLGSGDSCSRKLRGAGGGGSVRSMEAGATQRPLARVELHVFGCMWRGERKNLRTAGGSLGVLAMKRSVTAPSERRLGWSVSTSATIRESGLLRSCLWRAPSRQVIGCRWSDRDAWWKHTLNPKPDSIKGHLTTISTGPAARSFTAFGSTGRCGWDDRYQ